MKKHYSLAAVFALLLFMAANRSTPDKYGMHQGTPEIKSISAIAFGPDGIIFIGDSRSASVFAVDTKDKTAVEKATAVEVKNVDQKIAAALGTEAKNIRIVDIAVNPLSKKVYCAVQSADGTPVLLSLEGDKVNWVSLKDIMYSNISIANVPAEDAKDRGGRPLREQTISDMGYADGSVMLSGISN